MNNDNQSDVARLRGDNDVLRLRLQAARADAEILRTAIRRLAEQDATLSVCDGAVTVTMDATPSRASAGSENTHMATARLSAANTWLQEEIKRLRLTDGEREAVCQACDEGRWYPNDYHYIHTLRGLLERMK